METMPTTGRNNAHRFHRKIFYPQINTDFYLFTQIIASLRLCGRKNYLPTDYTEKYVIHKLTLINTDLIISESLRLCG